MRKLAKYFYEPKKMESIVNEAIIILDTNILLSAYQWQNTSFKEVIEVLKMLADEKRLKIPSHVISEFFDQRPKKIMEMIENIEKKVFSKIQKPEKLISVVPGIESLKNNDELEIETEYFKAYDMYRNSLKNLKSKLKEFINYDPILKELQGFLEQGYFEIDDFDEDKFNSRATERAKKKIPPLTGGDSRKQTNAYGDYRIWEHILTLNCDVIFVTNDFKPDWAIVDHDQKFISARRELIEEFYEKNGTTFNILPLAELIKFIEPEVSQDVIKDIDKPVITADRLKGYLDRVFEKVDSHNLAQLNADKSIKGQLRRIFIKYDPLNNYNITSKIDVYDGEINMLMNSLPDIKSIDELIDKVSSTFIETAGIDLSDNILAEIVTSIWSLKHALDI